MQREFSLCAAHGGDYGERIACRRVSPVVLDDEGWTRAVLLSSSAWIPVHIPNLPSAGTGRGNLITLVLRTGCGRIRPRLTTHILRYLTLYFWVLLLYWSLLVRWSFFLFHWPFSGNHTFLTSSKNEAGVFESFWEGTEISVSFV